MSEEIVLLEKETKIAKWKEKIRSKEEKKRKKRWDKHSNICTIKIYINLARLNVTKEELTSQINIFVSKMWASEK